MNKHDLSKIPVSQVVLMLGTRFKEYRLTCNLTQEEVSKKTGINKTTIRKFENGQLYNITLQTFLKLLNILNRIQYVDDLLPEIPMSAYIYEKIMNNKPKRASHARQ